MAKWFPFGGAEGIFLALPFAIWFYLAIEELLLAAEESADPTRDIPRVTIFGLLTLAFLVLGVGGETTANILGLAAVAGIIASFHTIIFAYGRNIFSLSRAGYYPHSFSSTHGTRGPRRTSRSSSARSSATGSRSSSKRRQRTSGSMAT